MNVAPVVEHGWKFELSGSHLILTSEEDPQVQVQINARAAYSLLNYLYQYRDDLHDEASRLEDEEVEQQKKEHSSSGQSDGDETSS
jgi:hypothetical protein